MVPDVLTGKAFDMTNSVPARVIVTHRTFRELPSGWLCKETGQHYKTAFGCLAAVRRSDKCVTATSPCAVAMTVITWEPISSIGRAIILSLGGKTHNS